MTWTFGSDAPPTNLYVGATGSSPNADDIQFTMTDSDPDTVKSNLGTALDPRILFLNGSVPRDVTNNSSNPQGVVVGEPISLQLIGLPAVMATEAQYSWSIDGFAIGDYKQQVHSAVITNLGDNEASRLDKDGLTFYWTQPSDTTLRAQLTVTSHTGTAQEISFTIPAYFDVVSPTADFHGLTTTDKPPVNKNFFDSFEDIAQFGPVVSFGSSTNPTHANAGIRLFGSVYTSSCNPESIPGGVAAGQVEIVQLTSDQTSWINGTGQIKSVGTGTIYAYDGGGSLPATADVPAYGTGLTAPFVDSPCITWQYYLWERRDFRAVDYLMYKPEDGVWVTLEKLNWKFGEVIENGAITTQYSTTDPLGIPSTFQPQWDYDAKDFGASA
jgi:hypothetical protein